MKRGLNYSLACLVAAALLAGCGGGGTGGKKRSAGVLSLTFLAEIGSASGPVGNSHKVTVYRNDGSIVDTRIIDTTAGNAQESLTGLPSGTLRLHVGLSAIAGGAEIGAVDTTFQADPAPAPMQFAMRKTVTQAFLTPSSPTVDVGATQQLYGTGKASDGSFVYTAPTDWTWSSETPAFATVDNAGLVTGVAEGGSAITATHTASGKAASTNVGVLSNVIRRGKWTVMVYVNAANNLFQEAVDNVNQMEKIANNPDVRFVIQWKQVRGIPSTNSNPIFSGTRRYLATYDSMGLTNVGQTIKSTVIQDLGGGVDMGSGPTLGSFVTWAKNRYPADHYALVLWDHGSGWFTSRAFGLKTRGISLDDETNNLMTPGEVRNALAGQTVDILAYDACVMQGAEDLIEMSDKADFIIGSEENTPGPGYPYNTVFKPMVDSPDTSVRELTKPFVTAYHDRYRNDREWKNEPLHQSVLETSHIAPFQLALDAFASDMASSTGVASNIRSACNQISAGDFSYLDIDQICEKAIALRPGTALATHATDLRVALTNMIVLNGTNANGSFMKGLSIEFANAGAMNGSYGTGYTPLRIAQFTGWDEFLRNTTANP